MSRMVDLANRKDYSYHDDPRVPAFDDAGPIVFMDGECALCSAGARAIARLDRRGEFRICPIQTPLGRGVLAHYGLDADDADSWLYLADGRAYASIDAMIRVGERVGGLGRIMSLARVLPRAAQDWLYRAIARRRYRLFGRTSLCTLPDPELRRRLME
jgi:predicted DCC family thiol-disulfide oxidoreductase YuxK